MVLSHSRPLLRLLNALNVYKKKIYQHLNFMYKYKNNQITVRFNDIIKKLVNQYFIQFSKDNFNVKNFSLWRTKYPASIRGPKMWDEFFTHETKSSESHKLLLKNNWIFTNWYCQQKKIFLKWITFFANFNQQKYTSFIDIVF